MLWAAEAIFQLANLIDAGQTADIHREPQIIEGTGPLCASWAIGSKPSVDAAVQYKAAEGIAHLAITLLLRRHPKLLNAWQAVTITTQLGVDAHNYLIGLAVRF